MSLFFADVDNITFGVQGSNAKEVAQFSSTLDDVFMRFFTNNGGVNDNMVTGTVIGSSNYDKLGSNVNNLYLGHVYQSSNIQRIVTIQDTRVGINTDAPLASLHVVGSNVPYSNIVQVEAINSPAYPALVIDKYGYVGIGTQAVSGQELTVKGTLVVDQIKIGGGESGPNSNLISAYGMAPPNDINYLSFANTTFCNVAEIVTPQMTATNVLQTFTNIANNTFLDTASVSVGTILPTGSVSFTTTFKGNAPSYTYTLTVTSNNYTYTTAPRTSSGSSDTNSYLFSPGSYQVAVNANTSGVGAGSSFTSNNIASFTVNATDPIGTPTVTLTGTPTFSSTLTYVSGIPYYTSGVTMTLPIASLSFTNIYSNIDPRTALTNVLQLRDGTNGTNTTNYTYANVFSNVLISNNTNNSNLALTLTSSSTASTVAINRKVYNINNQSGVDAVLLSGISYVGSAINEAAMDIATFTNMPITNAYRMTIAGTSGTPTTPTISDVSSYTGTPSQYDSFYTPYSTGRFYSSAGSISRGTYAPSYSAPAGSHAYLTFKLTTNAPLSAFVLNLTGATGISNVYVYWQSLGAWYDAKTLYNAGGCAASTYTSGTRFPVRIPQNAVLSSATDVFININFSGMIIRSGVTITDN